MKKYEKHKINGISVAIHHSGDTFIVCCHGLYSNKNSKKYLEIADLAHTYELSCIRFDFSGCGESENPFSTNLEDKVIELTTVINFAKKRYPNSKFALFGSSFGGMTALRYASRHPVSALVIMSTPAFLSLDGTNYDVQDDAKNCTRTFIAHGIQDKMVSISTALILYHCLKEPKKISIYQTDHFFSHSFERSKALNQTISWINRYIE